MKKTALMISVAPLSFLALTACPGPREQNETEAERIQANGVTPMLNNEVEPLPPPPPPPPPPTAGGSGISSGGSSKDIDPNN